MEFLNRHNAEPNNQLKSLFSRQYKLMLVYGAQITPNQNIVEDSIQDLFLKFCENENLIIGIRNQHSYLKASLRREIIRKMDTMRTETGPTLLEISVPSYEQLLIQNQSNLQDSIKIQAGLANLSPSQKSVITLRFYKGMTYQDIADKMGTSKRTVYNQVHEAVKKMRISMPK